ncbi:MAG: hypothetical protein IKC73_00995, partial [Clostridia bacterium]|nr:hypothetical protein [Clostridia bacterium]
MAALPPSRSASRVPPPRIPPPLATPFLTPAHRRLTRRGRPLSVPLPSFSAAPRPSAAPFPPTPSAALPR